MALELLGSGFWGWIAILVLGGLLAWSAALLPRILRYRDTGPVARWGAGGPGSDLTPPAVPADVARTASSLPPREPWASRPETAGDDPQLAAAIGLAMTLYQQEPVRVVGVQAVAAGGSPWALAGRWQAMQARINRQKR